MKSFILPVPKTPSKIDYHYFCECGSEFVSNNGNEICKCGNSRFYDYDDIKNYNVNLLEIEKIKNGYVAFFEYPVFRGNIKIERKVIFKYEDFLKFEDLSGDAKNKDDLIAEFVKLVMIRENKWKKYYFLLERMKINAFVLLLIIHKDPEMALWSYVDIEKIHKLSVKEFLEKFLTDKPKSIKKAVFYRYKKLIKKWKYNYYFDLLVFNAIDDVNLQRELIKKATNLNTVFYSNDEEILEFAKFLKNNFTQRKIYNFLQKTIKSKNLSEYISLFRDKEITIIDKKSIENTLLKTTDEIEYVYKFNRKYQFKNFIFELPKTSFDLVRYSFELKNCLESYIKIHNNKSLIFGVYEENRLKYAIELDITSKKLIQARGFANSRVNNKDYKVIVDFVNEFKEAI
ncbi:PcfJ domain-containing protein [Nautilia lithotrophica]